jgi:hypothetical protein
VSGTSVPYQDLDGTTSAPWLSVADKHDLKVDFPFTLGFPDGHSITAEVRLQDYGTDKGMLIVSNYSVVESRCDEIVRMGYSCFSQPAESEIDSDEGLKDILDDWGKNTA